MLTRNTCHPVSTTTEIRHRNRKPKPEPRPPKLGRLADLLLVLLPSPGRGGGGWQEDPGMVGEGEQN